MSGGLHLILGGARSGKSLYGEQLAAQAHAAGHALTYIATAQTTPNDAEFSRRIAHHQARRASSGLAWHETPAPFGLAQTLHAQAQAQRTVLVDCLTVWLSNQLFYTPDGVLRPPYPEVGEIDLPHDWLTARAALLAQLESSRTQGHHILLISNEVGLGVVPMGAVSRCFVDEAGRLNQALAALCDRVTFVAAGLPLTLKG